MKRYFSLILLTLIGNGLYAEHNLAQQKKLVQQEQETPHKFSSIFEHMAKEMEAMHQHMLNLERSFFDDMKNVTQKKEVSNLADIDINQNDNSIIVTIKADNIKAQELKDIELENNKLYAEIPTEHGIIELALNKNYIEVIQKAQSQKKDTAEDKQQEQHQKQYMTSYASSHYAMNLPAQVDIDNAQAELQGNTLRIILPKIASKKLKINRTEETDIPADLK